MNIQNNSMISNNNNAVASSAVSNLHQAIRALIDRVNTLVQKIFSRNAIDEKDQTRLAKIEGVNNKIVVNLNKLNEESGKEILRLKEENLKLKEALENSKGIPDESESKKEILRLREENLKLKEAVQNSKGIPGESKELQKVNEELKRAKEIIQSYEEDMQSYSDSYVLLQKKYEKLESENQKIGVNAKGNHIISVIDPKTGAAVNLGDVVSVSQNRTYYDGSYRSLTQVTFKNGPKESFDVASIAEKYPNSERKEIFIGYSGKRQKIEVFFDMTLYELKLLCASKYQNLEGHEKELRFSDDSLKNVDPKTKLSEIKDWKSVGSGDTLIMYLA